MIFIKWLGCLILFILVCMDVSKTKLNVAIMKIPGLEFKRYLRQNILRDKYGDACLKVAIRKCFKALMEVRKKICRMKYRCKSKFKSDFKEFSKTGCIEEFDYSTDGDKLKAKKKIISRQLYLDTCIPHMVPQNKKKNVQINLRNDVLRSFLEQILRSSSERKCEKLSRKKCRKACNYAKDEVCKQHSCRYRKKRDMKKSCKRECKKEYIVRKKSSGSSSDSD